MPGTAGLVAVLANVSLTAEEATGACGRGWLRFPGASRGRFWAFGTVEVTTVLDPAHEDEFYHDDDDDLGQLQQQHGHRKEEGNRRGGRRQAKEG